MGDSKTFVEIMDMDRDKSVQECIKKKTVITIVIIRRLKMLKKY